MRKQKGFSLIELLIVVAIILIIAAIAVPNLLRAKMAANESSAVGSIRTINAAEISYSSSYPSVGYAASLAQLGGVTPCTPSPATGCLIDSILSGGVKAGYNFSAIGTGGPPQFAILCDRSSGHCGPNGNRAASVRSRMLTIRVDPTGGQSPAKLPARPCNRCPKSSIQRFGLKVIFVHPLSCAGDNLTRCLSILTFLRPQDRRDPAPGIACRTPARTVSGHTVCRVDGRADALAEFGSSTAGPRCGRR